MAVLDVKKSNLLMLGLEHPTPVAKKLCDLMFVKRYSVIIVEFLERE